MQRLLLPLILVGVLGVIVALAHAWLMQGSIEGPQTTAQAAGPRGDLPPAPEFPSDIRWLQSEPLKLAELRGRVVIVHFWTFGCINCIHNYPVYKHWQEKYAGQDVTIIGVHTPELAHEADVSSVRAKARDNGLKFPIAIDAEAQIWKSWNNRYWPSIYLIDKQGRIRHHWDGELHLHSREGKQFASQIDELLAEKS